MASKQVEQSERKDVWIPKNPGDSLSGVLVDITIAWSDARASGHPTGDGNYPLLTVETPDGNVKWHAFETVSYSQVIAKRPIPGEQVHVTFDGIGEAKQRGKNPPKLFTLTVPGRDPVESAERAYSMLTARNGRGTVATPTVQAPSEPDQESIPF